MATGKSKTVAVKSVNEVEFHGYEFFGPYVCPFLLWVIFSNRDRIGAFVISFGLPIVIYLLIFLCNDIAGCPVPSVLHPYSLTIDKLKEEVGWPADGIWGLTSFKVTGFVLSYYLFSMILYRVLPGEIAEGLPTPSGTKLKYKINSMSLQERCMKHYSYNYISFFIFSIYCRPLYRRHCSSRCGLSCLDFYLGQLHPNTHNKHAHCICLGNLRLYKELRCEARQYRKP
jgi:hypothetical protein